MLSGRCSKDAFNSKNRCVRQKLHITERFHDIANNIDSLSLFFSSYVIDKKSVVLILCIFTSFVAVPRDFVSRGKYVFDPSLVAKLKNIKIFALIEEPIRLFSQIVSWAVRRKLRKQRRSPEVEVLQIWDWGKSQPRNYLQSNPAKRETWWRSMMEAWWWRRTGAYWWRRRITKPG